MSNNGEFVPDSQTNSPIHGEVGRVAQSDGDSSEQIIGSAQLEDIFHNWYNVDIKFEFDFPEDFQKVPAEFSSFKLWRQPMNSKEVIDRLLGNKTNEAEGDHLIQPIMVYFKEVIHSASKLFAEHQKGYSRNKHHLEVLLRAKDSKRLPQFLKLETPDINSAIFPQEEIASLRTEFRNALDKTSEELLALTIKARENIDADLRRKAAKLMEDVRESAKQKWIEAQTSDECTFNRWDNIFPVMFYDGATQQKFPVPLSAVIFRTAMKECRSKVCLELENELQRKTEAHALRRQEMDARRQAQSKASSLPPQEAEKSLEKRMKEMIAPFIAEVRTLKADLQKNEGALKRADPLRAHDRSAQESRKKEHAALNNVSGPAGTNFQNDPREGRTKSPHVSPAAKQNHPTSAQPNSKTAAPVSASASGSESGQRERGRKRRRKNHLMDHH